MKKSFFILFAFVFAYSCTPQDTPGTFKDIRDGKVYKIVTIGSQTWMAENLAFLPEVYGPTVNSIMEPRYYVYGYEGTSVEDAKATTNYKTYGVLYNWSAAMSGSAGSDTNPSGVRGICPEGWHLPSDAEWTQLETYLANNGFRFDDYSDPVTGEDVRDKIAKAVANDSGWNPSTVEGAVGNTDYPEYRNKSGFSLLPGGCRTFMSAFSYLGSGTYLWTSTRNPVPEADNTYYRAMFAGSSNMMKSTSYWGNGQSVRCVKD